MTDPPDPPPDVDALRAELALLRAQLAALTVVCHETAARLTQEASGAEATAAVVEGAGEPERSG